jgi:phospholipid/cholesterol/gamma-HCH transport system permease protein
MGTFVSMTSALAEPRLEADTLVTAVSGDWSLEQETPRFESVVAKHAGAARALTFDASQLGSWDSSLLVFLEQAQTYCDAKKIEMDPSGLPEQVMRLLTLSRAVPEREAKADEPAKASFVDRLGKRGIDTWTNVETTLTFAGEVTLAAVRLPGGGVRMRWREFWVVVQSNSSGALPIVTLIALLVGVIIAFLGVVVLERFGAGYYTSYLVGFGMLREMGALMTGIIMAGRTGAGFAAELGSMKITEEIDAFVTLGISPVEHLVLPRMLGILFMMPLLTLYADFVGIMGGMAVSVSMVDLSAKQFIGGLLYVMTLTDALLGVFKGLVFGLVIGFSGCLKGLQTGSDAGAVGRAATSAVVLGITLIILANAVIDWLAALLNI